MPVTWWRWLGRIPYADGLRLQQMIADERRRGLRPDTLLLLEHPPTLTLGRRAGAGDVLWSEDERVRRGIQTFRVHRGGGATYHGPGQLVGYPIAELGAAGRGVRAFVSGIEDVLAAAAAAFGVAAAPAAGRPGLWVEERKVASIGVEVRRRVSRHGFALNVDMDLEPFGGIVACNSPALRVTDLARTAGRAIAVTDAVGVVVEAWSRRFASLVEEPDEERRLAG
jgi:lipoate-protein ligase B